MARYRAVVEARKILCEVCDANKVPRPSKEASLPRDYAPLSRVALDVKILEQTHITINQPDRFCRKSGLGRGIMIVGNHRPVWRVDISAAHTVRNRIC